MGIERDYLMRQLMMLMEVISKIINFRKSGQLQQAGEEIMYFYNMLKLEADFHELSTEGLIDYLVNKKKLSNSQIELIAFVMKEQGEITEQPGLQQDYFHKAFFLLDKVDRESSTFSMDRQMKLAELRGYLQ